MACKRPLKNPIKVPKAQIMIKYKLLFPYNDLFHSFSDTTTKLETYLFKSPIAEAMVTAAAAGVIYGACAALASDERTSLSVPTSTLPQ